MQVAQAQRLPLASSWTRLGTGLVLNVLPTAWLTLPLLVLSIAYVAVVPAVVASFALQVPLFVALGVSWDAAGHRISVDVRLDAAR
jgi:hypothetical protein